MEISIRNIGLISSFIQLKDERIITLSEEITLILLYENNTFEIEQVLEEQTDNYSDPYFVVKKIEVKENELLSISSKYCNQLFF